MFPLKVSRWLSDLLLRGHVCEEYIALFRLHVPLVLKYISYFFNEIYVSFRHPVGEHVN